MSKRYALGGIIVTIMLAVFIIYIRRQLRPIVIPQNIATQTPSPTITPTPILLPQARTLQNDYHIFQTFNNCGPAALSMALSYYGIQKSQQLLGQELRPYQNPSGDNDDKSVGLDELAQNAASYGFIPFHRPNGSIQLIKQFIANDIPVITRTLLHENDDIGHFRVIKGYDDTTNHIIQDDSLQGKNLIYSYTNFQQLWHMFNYEYLVLVPADKEHIARTILGENIDEYTSWKKAEEYSRSELETNPTDVYARFNLSVALYHVGDWQGAVLEFEKIEKQLPFRALWYQIEPIRAYFELGNYQRVFEITNNIFTNQNRAFSELYLIRSDIYTKQGNLEAAQQEREKAILYNKNLPALQSNIQ